MEDFVESSLRLLKELSLPNKDRYIVKMLLAPDILDLLFEFMTDITEEKRIIASCII